MANGLQTAGMLLGGAVTPLLVVLLTESFGWKGALLWSGAFVSGSVFALAAAGIWLFIDSDRRARVEAS